jgi:hypothetical protein
MHSDHRKRNEYFWRAVYSPRDTPSNVKSAIEPFVPFLFRLPFCPWLSSSLDVPWLQTDAIWRTCYTYFAQQLLRTANAPFFGHFYKLGIHSKMKNENENQYIGWHNYLYIRFNEWSFIHCWQSQRVNSVWGWPLPRVMPSFLTASLDNMSQTTAIQFLESGPKWVQHCR